MNIAFFKKLQLCILFTFIPLFACLSRIYGQDMKTGLYGKKSTIGYSVLSVGNGACMLLNGGGLSSSFNYEDITIQANNVSGYWVLGYKYVREDGLAMRFNCLYGSYDGSDTLNKDEIEKYYYKNRVLGFSALMQKYLIPQRRRLSHNDCAVYLLGGAGLEIQNPEVLLGKTSPQKIAGEINLLPVIPVGVGVELFPLRKLSISAELGIRYSVLGVNSGVISANKTFERWASSLLFFASYRL